MAEDSDRSHYEVAFKLMEKILQRELTDGKVTSSTIRAEALKLYSQCHKVVLSKGQYSG